MIYIYVYVYHVYIEYMNTEYMNIEYMNIEYGICEATREAVSAEYEVITAGAVKELQLVCCTMDEQQISFSSLFLPS